MFKTALEVMSEVMPFNEDLDEWHEWSLKMGKGTFMLTRYLWNSASRDDKVKAKTLIEKTAMTNIARKCKICFCKYLCSGGCPLINLNTTGNVYKPDPYRCYITKKLVTHFLTNG
jgi:radical SAM protein with 4Fe4S-binding SPASM domain